LFRIEVEPLFSLPQTAQNVNKNARTFLLLEEEMREQKSPCVYETQVRIDDKKWRWCSFYNARIDDVGCENCRLRNQKEIDKTVPPQTASQ